ncbi:MAG: hypothetical protein HOQ37_23190, partial [Cupriavidus sp.]|nr:hypothetical protein [Cupriavidus sp.]
VLQYFEHSGAAKTLERLRRIVSVTALGKMQGMAEKPPHVERKLGQVLLAAPDPEQWFFFGWHRRNIPELV